MQRNMAANCGLNYISMAHFIGCIALRQLHRNRPDGEGPPDVYQAFSLQRACLVLRELQSALLTNGSLDPSLDTLCQILTSDGVVSADCKHICSADVPITTTASAETCVACVIGKRMQESWNPCPDDLLSEVSTLLECSEPSAVCAKLRELIDRTRPLLHCLQEVFL